MQVPRDPSLAEALERTAPERTAPGEPAGGLTDLVRSPGELRAAFLERLLRALHAGTGRLRGRLDSAGPEAVAGLERRLGWGWAVANELAGAGGGPARRERRGAAWLAACLDHPGLAGVSPWPALRPERSDWRAAYALVLTTLCALEAAPAARARVARAPGAWDWALEGVGRPPTPALVGELERTLEVPTPLTARGDDWRLALPCDWWPAARECAR